MSERDLRERDILVAPLEYAYVQDLTKGDIVLYVGPTKISLSNTERLVEYWGDRFVPIRSAELGAGVQPFVAASSSQYILLENPPKDAAVAPVKGANYAVELLIGRRVVVPGPATFSLWPGQKACVIDGHELAEDQYVVVRVYDRVAGDDSPIGAERIIKGTDVSFYIPPTGLEVIPDGERYVRSAVGLMSGEYCILRAPDGSRAWRRGPAVVFPERLETFVTVGGARVFPAHHLRKNMGLHVRVTADFQAEEGDQVPPGAYAAGQELFIQDREGYFYPTETLEVLGEVEAIPLAEKEGIYVREIHSGMIRTVTGPRNHLPDPTRVELAHRSLSGERRTLYGVGERRAHQAVAIYIPPSMAVLVTARDRREVVLGPQTRILDFDEELEVLRLSTGRPKRDDELLATCFLQTSGNKVSDVLRVKSGDHVELEITLSYRVSFVDEGEPSDRVRWFNVNNYVGLLCEHLGSIVRGAVRGTSIDVFHAQPTEVIRAAILGRKEGEGKRTGRVFAENGMWVYDVEVLDVKILDADVKQLLQGAQKTAITFEVERKQEHMRLTNAQVKEEVERLVAEARIATCATAVQLEEARRALAVAETSVRIERDRIEQVGRARSQAEALALTSEARAMAAAREGAVEAEALASRVRAFEAQMAAVSPELITTLKVLGDQQLSAELTRNLSPLAILGGESVAEVASRLMAALPVGLQLNAGALEARPVVGEGTTRPPRDR